MIQGTQSTFFSKNCLLIVKANYFPFAFSTSYNSKISTVYTADVCVNGNFRTVSAAFFAYLTLENARPSWFDVYEQDLTCKIPLLLINSTSTFCVEEYHYHLYCNCTCNVLMLFYKALILLTLCKLKGKGRSGSWTSRKRTMDHKRTTKDHGQCKW